MSREVINVGAAPNDGQGDPIRTSFIKCNNNFGELYARAQENPPATLVGTVGDVAGMYAYSANYFYYCYQDYDGSSTIWAEIPNTVIDAIEIRNGTSTVSIPTANGNVNVSVAGTANVAVFTNTGLVASSVTSIGNLVGNTLVLPVNSKIIGYFSASGQDGRTLFQTSNTDANATTFVSAAPGANNTNPIKSALTCFASTDYANAQVFGIYAYSSESRLHSRAFGTATVNPLTVYVGAIEAARWTNDGNLGLGNTAPVDRLAVDGNAYVSGNLTADNLVGNVNAFTLTVNGLSTFSGNLIPSANITYDLGNSTNRWKDIWLANSTVYLGDSQLQANAGALILSGPAGGEVTVTGSMGSGTLNAQLITATANVTGGNLITAGAVSAAGTVTGGNITTGGQITATGNIFTNGLFIGNGSGLTGVVAVANVGAASQLTNGTTNLNIPVADGNIVGNIGGSVNLFEFSTVGFSAQGNVTAGNLNTAGAVTATGNITGGNIRTAGTVSATGNITSSGVFVGDGSGLTNVVGNIGSASQLTSGTTQINIPVASGNIVANVAGSSNLFEWSTVGFSAQGNVTGGNLITGGLALITGNVSGGNLLTGGVISATGNITGNYVLGNGSQLSGIITSVANINSGTSIMEVVSSGGNISANIGGVANVQVIATSGTFVTGLHSVTGNIIGGNITTGGTISATGNITAGNLSVNTGTVSVGAILNNNANGVGNIGTTGTRFNTVFALASSAQYADLAEYYLADQTYSAGTVVAFGGPQELTQCDQDHDVTVAGIISDRPAFEMNAGIQGDHPVALALAGRVPCHVVGPVKRGEMLVSAGGGRARAESNPRMGAVIGKALEDFDGTTGTIEVVVGRI